MGSCPFKIGCTDVTSPQQPDTSLASKALECALVWHRHIAENLTKPSKHAENGTCWRSTCAPHRV